MSESVGAVNAALQRSKTTFKVTVFRRRKTKQVLFLEAGKDFVDILFSFLLLPVGTILHILSQGIQVKPHFGGMSRILRSVGSSFIHGDKLQGLVQPRIASMGCTCKSSGLLLQRELEAAEILSRPPKAPMVLSGDYFLCSYWECSGSLLSTDRGERCEGCNSADMPGHYTEGPYTVQEKIDRATPSEGFVKENIKFIVTDRLEITPSTVLTILSLLKIMEVANSDLDDLEGTETAVSITQILQLLHSALTSNTCLNDVFGLKK